MAVQVSNAFEFDNVIFEIEHLQYLKSVGDTGGTEQDVKTLWLNILGHIFPSNENFGYGSERRHVAGNSDFMVFKYGRYLDSKFRVDLLLVEAKGLDKDNAGDWTSAEDQLEAYGVDMPNSSDLTYGAIPIGLCVAFYEMRSCLDENGNRVIHMEKIHQKLLREAGSNVQKFSVESAAQKLQILDILGKIKEHALDPRFGLGS